MISSIFSLRATPSRYRMHTRAGTREPTLAASLTSAGVRIMRRSSTTLSRSDSENASCGPCTTSSPVVRCTPRLAKPLASSAMAPSISSHSSSASPFIRLPMAVGRRVVGVALAMDRISPSSVSWLHSISRAC